MSTLRIKPAPLLWVKAISLRFQFSCFWCPVRPWPVLSRALLPAKDPHLPEDWQVREERSHIYCWLNRDGLSFTCAPSILILQRWVRCCCAAGIPHSRLPWFVVYCVSCLVHADLFSNRSLFDQIGRLDFGLMWISVMPARTRCNDTV